MITALQITGLILGGFNLGVMFARHKSVHYKLRRSKGEEVFPIEEVQAAISQMGFTREFAKRLTGKMLAAGVLFRRPKE